MVVVAKYLIPKGYVALTVFPFVFLRGKEGLDDAVLLNHEKIHLRQQAELLIVFFFIWYFSEFLWRFFQNGNWAKAYRAISFEKEAYANEIKLSYLKNRPFWHFLNFIR